MTWASPDYYVNIWRVLCRMSVGLPTLQAYIATSTIYLIGYIQQSSERKDCVIGVSTFFLFLLSQRYPKTMLEKPWATTKKRVLLTPHYCTVQQQYGFQTPPAGASPKSAGWTFTVSVFELLGTSLLVFEHSFGFRIRLCTGAKDEKRSCEPDFCFLCVLGLTTYVWLRPPNDNKRLPGGLLRR